MSIPKQAKSNSFRPGSQYSIKIKRSFDGLNFYNQNENLYAKIEMINKNLLLIGLITLIFIIGFFILFFAILATSMRKKKLITSSGEILGTIETKITESFSNVILDIPSINWTGTLSFSKKGLKNKPSSNVGTLTSSEGNFNIKMSTMSFILEDKIGKQQFTLYWQTISQNADYFINIDEKFNPIIACLTSWSLINVFLIEYFVPG